ncbi:E3 ubiquitin-protein ligase rnf213-alpha isoform X6 [Syngnathus acus]|uniref:E3 ubiquitin-protein ligase rnf213-alpha isoform X6 n=1 Tax=Syngnathus acus TaxID=161584 RepID=UPI001885AF0F|nr:E3 ubiquitin-protein ligase rnf213-alpha isoform X6 [Syngnathus acus]
MKCTKCGFNALKKKHKFCSECGFNLSVQPPNNQEGNEPASLVPDLDAATDTTAKHNHSADNKDSNKKSKKKARKKKAADQSSSREDQSGSFADNTNNNDAQTENSQSEVTSGPYGEEDKDESNAQKSVQDSGTTQHSDDSTSFDANSGAGETSEAGNTNTEETKKSESKRENGQAVCDQNANVAQESAREKEPKVKQPGTVEQTMIFGPQPQTPSKVLAQDRGSSVDPHNATEDMGVQRSNANYHSQHATIPTQPTDARLTIYFHAILSKDFKFNLNEDSIYIRAGPPLAKWEDIAVRLFVTRDLNEHGFLVQGVLETNKTRIVSQSIPYKYVVDKKAQGKPIFEYIYKENSDQSQTNRCLFVKPHLLNEDGEWHQYDDIVCVKPEKGILKQFIEGVKSVWTGQRKQLVQGRDIAGEIMMDTIFDLLKTWTEKNLETFLKQLNQFFDIYSNPSTHEGSRHTKWTSLNYDENHVRNSIKDFMLKDVTPRVQGNVNAPKNSLYIEDPLRAAAIMLYVCERYCIKLDITNSLYLCAELCLPKLDKSGFLEYWKDLSRDLALLPSLPSSLFSLIKTVKDRGHPQWILALPLFHLLDGKDVQPFQVLTSGHGLKNLGSGEINSESERKGLLKMMKDKRHLMEVDPLAARSGFYLMSLGEFKDCSINMNIQLLDMLNVFSLKAPRSIGYHNSKDVSEILSHIQSKVLDMKHSDVLEADARSCLAVAVKLFDKICKGATSSYKDIPVECMKLVASVFDLAVSYMQQEAGGDGKLPDAEEISKAMRIMRSWMSSQFKENLLSRSFSFRNLEATQEMEVWNHILGIHFNNNSCQNEWMLKLSLDFEGRYKKEKSEDQIAFYFAKIEKLENSLQNVSPIIEKCALEAVTSVCQTKSEVQLLENFKMNNKFVKIFSAILQSSWPKDQQGNYEEKEEVVLQHLLTWTGAKHILQLSDAEENLFDMLTLDAKDRVTFAMSILTNIKTQFIKGNIPLKLLRMLVANQKAFIDLLKSEDTNKMKRLLKCRAGELHAVEKEKKQVDALLTMIRHLDEYMAVDVCEMDELRRVNMEMLPLDHFMEVHPVDQIPPAMAGVVTYFKMNERIRHMSDDLDKFKDSHVFILCWKEQGRLPEGDTLDDNPVEEAVPRETLTFDELCEDIFEPCMDDYTDIYNGLKDGSIGLEEVNRLFGNYKGKYAELERDLEIMCKIDMSTDKQWIHTRLQQIEQFHELRQAADSAEVILAVKETLCLQGDFSVLETLLDVSHADTQEKELRCIDNALIEAKKDLVDITEPRRLCLNELKLRGHFVKWVKDALKDLKDLKVFVDLAFISAGENDMEVDRVACFHDAIHGYAPVLYELPPNSGFLAFKEVLKKLWSALDKDNNLPKKMRDSGRHLEWLKTVKDSHGSVELSSMALATAINRKGIYWIRAVNGKKVSLDTVLDLDEEEDEMHCYSLEDVRELQNKLMLMSGKGDQGQQEVNYFAEVFAGVQRLAEAFIALYTAGNPLFRHWEAQVHCCLNGNVNIEMNFNLGKNVHFLTIEDSLPELCLKMEDCLALWMEFLDTQRFQHYYLNYFTAEQIFFLCSNLSEEHVKRVDDQVLMMLSFIKSHCTASDVSRVWHELQNEVVTHPQEQNEESEFQEMNTEVQANRFESFNQIWEDYMKDPKHILDIQSLGKLLERLAKKDDVSEEQVENFIKRELPKSMAAGKPNLLVCPQTAVLTSCISIYMTSHDQPLPTYDEVLLCNSTSTYEQVELFLRRCLSASCKDKKIYCLLFGELLPYDVSSKVEKFFQRMNVRCTADYRLVLLCSSEKEHAYLPSAFSQYRLQVVPQLPLTSIQKYLQHHYVVPTNQSSAAAVFKDGLCVGTVSSERAGVGKSLYIKRIYQSLKEATEERTSRKCIRLIEPSVDEHAILQSLLESARKDKLTVFHFDITSSVRKGIHEFLFKLLILRYLMDSEGNTWKCSNKDLYLIEFLEETVKPGKNASAQTAASISSFADVFPKIICRPPKDVLELAVRKKEHFNDNPLMDDIVFKSSAFQRPYQYLRRFHNNISLDGFNYKSNNSEGSEVECLQLLLIHCGISDPSWAELRNFTWFLNLQLQDCEKSVFCDAVLTGDILNGFKTFVVGFMIVMARDFATTSESISDQSPGKLQMDLNNAEEDLAPFLIRKRWEKEPHPYIFFNEDHSSMTFIGFYLRSNSQNAYDAIDPRSGTVIKTNVMSKELYQGLHNQGVPFNINFDSLRRSEKIQRLCNVLGIKEPFDPDPTYELTTDNILKMLAIHMRFRCGIPVIIMGETGCGKTRLIKYLCELRRNRVAAENMKLVKVHGGTSSQMIYAKVRESEAIASSNKQKHGFDSVLFLDEANTTEAISSIKEVLCDKTVKGVALDANSGLQIIAACNPYRKHTDKMIKRLESAGLGYRVRAEETDEKLGSIPLRQLVYRVQALPPSMISLVWDFGQLNDQTEEKYIEQIVTRVVQSREIPEKYFKCITLSLSSSQKYMRGRSDECSFVSLRDVERCMQVFVWLHDHHRDFFAELREFDRSQNKKKQRGPNEPEGRDPVLWSLIIALGVCYHACLEQKNVYRNCLSKSLPSFYTAAKIREEITLMQDLLLSGVPMVETIARNAALKENVFMMVFCIELRIPLFLVGKPGTSKSLSKTLVADAMQGQAAHSELYKMFKQIHLVSFQCSPHSTSEGIINIFKQCGRYQEGKNLEEYISVVVLDEIGLAEDSPKMPLKTLHPLLEEGCIDDEPLAHKKVGFIGISNWALDPAKMNRGISVSRGDPDKKELIESAEGICSSDVMVLEKVRELFTYFARAYINIVHKKGKGFFGLRDYYSLIKMVYAMAKTSQRKPTIKEITKAILRNFSGKNDVDAMAVFNDNFCLASDPENISAIEFVRENIQSAGQEEECRYLLILTRNYAALQILQQTFFSEIGQPEIIFGSSFPKDQEYTQICRNINRVKICMETGKTVVLLNLQNLYESLYDALNQYYVYLGGQKYVDLGLGTHRVKCRVHDNFRLIVIEEREVVYKQFPVPLINRLEKHYLDIYTVLTAAQKRMVEKLDEWVRRFVSVSNHIDLNQTYKYHPSDVFIGYHSDACASVIHQVIEKTKDAFEIVDAEQRLLREGKFVLLRCATPDSVMRLEQTDLPNGESEELANVYFEHQNNNCLVDFIVAHTRQEVHRVASFTEVTTFSRLLTAPDLKPLEQMLQSVTLLSLQQFDAEHLFLKEIRNFLTADEQNLHEGPGDKVLIVQSEFKEATHSLHLIASAKYSAVNEITKITQDGLDSRVFVYFITRLPRVQGGTCYVGFHGDPWTSVHLDDLRKPKDIFTGIRKLQNTTICQLFETKMNQPQALEAGEAGEVGEVGDANEEEPDPMDVEHNKDDTGLDTTALVRSCVQSAVGMLRDQQGRGWRSTQRLETLLILLSDTDQVKGDFLQILKNRLYLLLASESNFSSASSNWVNLVASNIDALQEGGTFCHSLWKRIQAVVTPALAQLVSVIDADQNLDILLEDHSPSVKRLWLHIFADDKLLEIPQPSLDSETKTIPVRSYIAQGRDFTFNMPFCGRIKHYLEELWVHAHQNEGHTQRFIDFFAKTSLGQYIAKDTPEMQYEFFDRYLCGFLFLTINVNRQEDLKLLHAALNSCVTELRREFNDNDAVPALPWVHAAYHQSKNRLQNLFRMVCLEPQVTDNLLTTPEFTDGVELVLDVYAALVCLEYLEPGPLETNAQRQAWVRRVNKLKVPIELVCSEESVRHYRDRSKTIASQVRARWNRIFSLSLFVEHFETQQNEITPFAMKHMRRLNQALENNSDLKSQQPFEAMIRLLKTCKDEAVQQVFRFSSVPWCSLCQGDPHDPVCLPCEHIFCLSCIKKCLVPCQMHVCPHCKQALPDDFTPVLSEDLRVRVEQHALFRNQCNAFFIDLVSSVCFKDNSPPCPAVIRHLLSFLLVEASAAPILTENWQTTTKVLSPFDDSADKNPVFRSSLLKLLLKYSFEDVKDYLQLHLLAVEQCHILEKKEKTKLYCIYLDCLQDAMFETFQFRSDMDKQAYMRRETPFLRWVPQQLGPLTEETLVTVEYLQLVARVRMDLDLAATIIATEMPDGGEPSQSDPFLESVVNLCSRGGNNWYRVYLVRKITSQRGVEFAQELLKTNGKHWLFPEEVQQKDGQAILVDHYLVYGEPYKKIRDAVSDAIEASQLDCLDKICQECTTSPQRATLYLLLALHKEVTNFFRNDSVCLHQDTELFCALMNFIDTSKVLANPKVKAFARALVTNHPGPLEVTPGTSGDYCASLALAVHLAVVLLCTNQKIVAPLQQLAIEPNTMQATFLPTMPQDKLAEAQQALGNSEPLRWYTCPNGHPCTVGECGLPMEKQTCPDCQAPIGGLQHKAVNNFRQLESRSDRTQTGHILGDPGRRDNADMMDTKHLSPVPFTVIRMLTHLAMLVGTFDHSQTIASIINPPVTEPCSFLLAHLKKDKEHLGRSLGKGTDDTIGAAHLLISGLLEPQQSCDSWRLSTNGKRNEWETQMSLCITPNLKHLDNQLKEMNVSIQTDSQNSGNPIMWLLRDNPASFLPSLRVDSSLHSSAVWSCKEKVSLQHLNHAVELNDGKDTLPVLWRFLNKEAELRLVRHLPDILTLHKELLKQFLNITEDSYGTIAQFLNSQTGPFRTQYRKHIDTFLTTWNQLRSSLATYDDIRVPAEFCQHDFDTESDLKVLLPQRHGPGLCSTALVSYLIGLHNDMVRCVDNHTGEKTSYEVSPVDLTDQHVIQYELDRDLMPLVLANTQYSVERGQETLREYDLPRIQKQIFSRFLLGKPIINLNGIPTLVNRPDRNYNILKNVGEKVKQEPLTTQTMLEMAKELHDYSEACEAVSILELALGFLATDGGDSHMRLSSYLEDVLQMRSQISDCVFKVLSWCYLKHCVALWQMLNSLKSEIMLMLNMDPFKNVCMQYKQTLGDNERRLLSSFFYGSSTDTFLLELHDLLVLELKNPKAPEERNPDWSLIAILDPCLEDKYPDFPSKICLSHCVETWKFIIAIKKVRISRQIG